MAKTPPGREDRSRKPAIGSAPQAGAQRALLGLLRQAEGAWKQLDYQKSIELIEQAKAADPSNWSILLNLARAYGLRYDYAAADRCLERAVQLSPRKAQTLAEAGDVCLEFGHLDMAMRYLGRASRANGVTLGVLIALAGLYLRERRLEDAADAVAQARQIDARDPRVALKEAVLRRMGGRPDEAERPLQALRVDQAAGPAVRIEALYELAGILDRGGRYDEAMDVLLEAKALQRPLAGAQVAALRAMHERAREQERTITAEVLERWRGEAEKLAPARRIALLCGHPRSGTTLLEQVLDTHPDVISSEETKLLHDEAFLLLMRDVPEGTGILPSLEGASTERLGDARESYFRCTERLLGKPVGGRLLIDKNPGLNGMIPAFVRIFPEARFLAALRDPRDVVLSCFMQDLPLTPISSAYLSLEGTVAEYASEMGFWLEMRPRLGERWVEVRYEELVDDLPGVARRVLEFLGVGFDEKVLAFHEHARGKRVNSPSRDAVVKPLYRSAVGRWRNYQKHLEPHLGTLERFLKAFGYE